MSLTINNNLALRTPAPSTTGTAALREQGIRQQGTQATVKSVFTNPASVRTQVAAPGTSGALPVQAPPGTDPELWSVLSAAERGFFAKIGAMGPLTYGRMTNNQTAPSLPAVRGGRLDIRG
jgi:hypothetical protein